MNTDIRTPHDQSECTLCAASASGALAVARETGPGTIAFYGCEGHSARAEIAR